MEPGMFWVRNSHHGPIIFDRFSVPRRLENRLRILLSLKPYLMATGLTGEPTPPTNG
jgi:hypothetical protein